MKYAIFVRNSIVDPGPDPDPELPANSLRPELFLSLPTEVVNAGFYPNDLSTAVRTDISGTSRSASIAIPSGNQSSSYVCVTGDRRYYLQGDTTFEGCGIFTNVANITVDLNGYTLTYCNVAPEGVETATVGLGKGGGGNLQQTLVVNAAAGTITAPTGNFDYLNYSSGDTVTFAGFSNGGNNTTKTVASITSNVITVTSNAGLVNESGNGNEKAYYYPQIFDPTGITLSSNSHAFYVIEFLDGNENGNFYEVLNNTSGNLVLENHTNTTDNTAALTSWQNGGPGVGDSFRTYDPRDTFGVGVGPVIYRDNIDIINGFIVQGTGYGRGVNLSNCAGMSPIQRPNGNGAWNIGGVSCTWHADNAGGIRIAGSNNSITYCELTDNGSIISNRQRNCAALSAGVNSTIQYNLINNHRHVGFDLVNRYGCNFSYNEVYGDSRSTNAAGVNIYNGSGNTISNNNIYKVGEHPICIALHSDGTELNEVSGNWCESQITRGSEEYGYNNAVGLSNRWGERDYENYVHDNAFTTYSEVFDSGSIGETLGRTLFVAQGDGVNWTSERIENNAIAAYNRDNSTKCHACGVTSTTDVVVMRENTLIGSRNIFWIGDEYGYDQNTAGQKWINNTIVKAGSDPDFITFDIDIDAQDDRVVTADFISNIYGTDTGQDNEDFNGTTDDWTDLTLRFGYNLTVTITSGGSPVDGASVSILDSSNNILRSGYLTNVSGQVIVDAPTYYRHTDGSTTTTFNPLTVSGVKGAGIGTDTISPVSDDTITVVIT